MKQFIFSFAMIALLFMCSCSKDLVNFNQEIEGNWVWKSSHSSNGTQMFSNDTTKTYHIQFNNDLTFTNTSFCIIGSQTAGTYETSILGNDKILILKSNNLRPDTLQISFRNSQLTLTETNDNYSWFHDFYKK